MDKKTAQRAAAANAAKKQMAAKQAAASKAPEQKEEHYHTASQEMNPEQKKRQKERAATQQGIMKFLNKVAKIDNLPKNVRDSIPLRGFMRNGIVETKPGTFTRTYRMDDVNFSIATDAEQTAIFKAYMDLLNGFNDTVRWQVNIFNHELDKKTTIENIRIQPAKDGLNKYRQEMNTILLGELKEGNNSIKQDKYLTVSIDDDDAEHAVKVLDNLNFEIGKKLRRITGQEVHALTTQERITLLYSIYNQNYDYRLATGIYKDDHEFSDKFLKIIERQGLSVKDVIGPSSFDFSNQSYFMIGDTYAEAMYLERVPTFLQTSFINDLADIQSNMLISVEYEAMDMEKAQKLIRGKLGTIEAREAELSKRNGENGYFGALPPDLERAQNNARDLMKDITSRNQKLFYCTFLVTVFADTKDELDEKVALVKNVAGTHVAPIKDMKFQQEPCFNSCLPLCRNDVNADRLYTTESAAVFIPYNTQEISQKNAIFYGLNSVSKSMILYDRTTGNNYNGLIFGSSGSGKSFTAKSEMVQVLLRHPKSQIFVIDPQGEYWPLAENLGGQHVVLAPGSGVYVNPLDLDLSEDASGETDPVTMKSDFVISMFDIIIGKNRQLDPIHTSILDKCVRKLYKPYQEALAKEGITFDPGRCPTLADLYQELRALSSEQYEAKMLADSLYQYAIGSFDTFAHRTNVETSKRFVVYDTKSLGTGMKELGLHICTNDVWNRMLVNSKKNIFTWLYIDEFHVLMESESTTAFIKKLWKIARKTNGSLTGITQNTEDLLRSADTRAIVNNTSFVMMLNEPLMDRQNLAELFNLSAAQLEYITDSQKGHGLLYNGKITLPFGFDFPKNTDLYKMMTTSHDVKDAMYKG